MGSISEKKNIYIYMFLILFRFFLGGGEGDKIKQKMLMGSIRLLI